MYYLIILIQSLLTFFLLKNLSFLSAIVSEDSAVSSIIQNGTYAGSLIVKDMIDKSLLGSFTLRLNACNLDDFVYSGNEAAQDNDSNIYITGGSVIEKIAVDKIITKYKKLYPKAVVYSSTDYYRGSYQSFPIVKVKFASGSEVSFTLGYGDELEKERFHKKYDAINESTEILMERFNNQKAK